MKIKDRNKLISALLSTIVLILMLLFIHLNPQIFYSHITTANRTKTITLIPTPPNSPIPTPTPNPCDYEISFGDTPPIREGSRVIGINGVPGTVMQVWNGNNGGLIGEAIIGKNGKSILNRIRPLMKNTQLLLTAKHDNAIYSPVNIIGTGYTLHDFKCLLVDPTAADIPTYRYVFQVLTVPPKGVTP